jgi:hypothetical protein
MSCHQQTKAVDAELYNKPIAAFEKERSAVSTLFLSDSGVKFSYDPSKWTLVDKNATMFKQLSEHGKRKGGEVNNFLVHENNDAFLVIFDSVIKSSYSFLHNWMQENTVKDQAVSNVSYDLRSVNGRIILHYGYSRIENGNELELDEYALCTNTGMASVTGSILKRGKTPRQEVISALNGLSAE